MAAPRRLNLVPVGLEIEIVPKFEGIDHTDSSSSWKYKITNLHSIFTNRHIAEIEEKHCDEGLLSPTHRTTLSRTARLKAGIPEEASSYAFMYPPQKLVEIFQSMQSDDNVDYSDELFVSMQSYHNDSYNAELFVDDFSDSFRRPDVPIEPEEAIKSAILLGGFAYFDDEFNCVCINALSRQESDRKLMFSGPFGVHAPVYEELRNMKRTQHLKLSIFNEVGFESFAWVRPNERILFEPILKNCNYSNGAFLFFRENRTAVAYVVDPSGHLDPDGEVGLISEAIAHIGEADFTQKVVQPLFRIKAWKNKIGNSVDTAKLVELDDTRTFLHKACHAALGAEFIDKSLSNSEEIKNLSYKDTFGWIPLMYACCFCPSDCALIMLLVKACPEAVMQSDHYGRCPLHIACDSDASDEVIHILLAADTSSSNDTLSMKTNRFGFLPLHVACYRGASDSIIEALLDADLFGKSVITKSRCEQLPLHLAILKRLPASIVKKLLDAASVVQNLDENDRGADIYQYLDSNLPLHLACWNNSSSEIIEMLLEKDKKNITTTMGMDTDKLSPHFAICDRPFRLSTDPLDFDYMETVALHLAVKHGSTDVISLLLQKDAERKNYDVISSTLYKKDTRGRTPLHIACECTGDHQLIKLLVELDTLKQTLQISDMQGYRPIHYACEKKNTSTEIIKILCTAEDRLIKRNKTRKKRSGEEKKKRSAHVGDKERNNTPLYLSVKTGAPEEVIEILMQPENFTLEGFDDHVLGDLADIVKRSENIQDKVTDILSARFFFVVILTELYANIIAMIALGIGSRQLLDGTVTSTCPSLLVFSSCVFLLREIVQIISVRVDYIGDIWSWQEIVTIIFLFIAADHMFREVGNPNPVLLTGRLCIAGSLLALQTIFYLRSTFLPFARFVGGLIMIFRDVIPFIIVSLLLLSAFIYASLVNIKYDCESYSKCFVTMFSNVFDFSPSEENSITLDIIFGVLIIIVLMNVLIAIVSQSWATAVKESTKFFWKCRLQKIIEFQCFEVIRNKMSPFKFSENCLLQYTDTMENISFKDDIPWNKAPYDNVTEKAHYDKPEDYFDSNISRKISEAKSLQADLYWNKIHSKHKRGHGLTLFEKVKLALKWLFRCIMYALTLVMGMLTVGIFFPKDFRFGFFSLGVSDEETEAFHKNSQESVHQTLCKSVVENNEPVVLAAHQQSAGIDIKPMLSKAEKKHNRAMLKMNEMKLHVELTELVLLKRKHLCDAGVPIDEIDLAIPVTYMTNHSGDLDYDSDLSNDPGGISSAETERNMLCRTGRISFAET